MKPLLLIAALCFLAYRWRCREVEDLYAEVQPVDRAAPFVDRAYSFFGALDAASRMAERRDYRRAWAQLDDAIRDDLFGPDMEVQPVDPWPQSLLSTVRGHAFGPCIVCGAAVDDPEVWLDGCTPSDEAAA